MTSFSDRLTMDSSRKLLIKCTPNNFQKLTTMIELLYNLVKKLKQIILHLGYIVINHILLKYCLPIKNQKISQFL